MLQVHVDALDRLLAAALSRGWPFHAGPREVWRCHGDRDGGRREFFLLDPDGFLVVIAQRTGERPLA